MVFKTLCIFGTRPEAIKMAPLVKQLNQVASLENKVCVTGQHRQMLDSVLHHFKIVPDFDLSVMVERQELSELTAKIIIGLGSIYRAYKPDLVLVHGDTTTTLAGSLSAYYHHIPVAHVEAGLRTGNIESPWPEEINRKLTGALAALHFAPTISSKNNLLREGIMPQSIYVTGNTVVDALFETTERLDSDIRLKLQLDQMFSYLQPNRRIMLVTGHRRENFCYGFERICQALILLAKSHPELDIVYPVHLNPNVHDPVVSLLGGICNIYLIDPLDYLPFVYLMQRSYLILTDSGGVQEEAPSLGKPVLRELTERPEAIEAGTVKIVGTQVNHIVREVEVLLSNEEAYEQMSRAVNPYGDGQASQRIAGIISELSLEKNAVLKGA